MLEEILNNNVFLKVPVAYISTAVHLYHVYIISMFFLCPAVFFDDFRNKCLS
jgi:hypothetical protein